MKQNQNNDRTNQEEFRISFDATQSLNFSTFLSTSVVLRMRIIDSMAFCFFFLFPFETKRIEENYYFKYTHIIGSLHTHTHTKNERSKAAK